MRSNHRKDSRMLWLRENIYTILYFGAHMRSNHRQDSRMLWLRENIYTLVYFGGTHKV